MTPRHRTFSSILCTTLAVLFTMVPVFAEQPHMSAALELLQAAKKADKPLPMLNAAKKHLEDASHNKAGARKEAIAAVNDAIAELRVGDKKKMLQKIDSAIANVHQGKDNGQ
jgi:hypothetical protein